MSIKVMAVYRFVQKRNPVSISEIKSAFNVDPTPKANQRLESVINHLIGNKLCVRNGDHIVTASSGRVA